jgi:phenylacetate-coenzyme A ligase PaaK-like adenylate-forming protein
MLVVLQALPRQRRLPFLPREEVLELRDRRLRELVAYAAAHVPYYLDLDPGDIGTAEDLARLPLLDKATVQRDPEQFRAGTPLARDALTFRTSGSTGTPVTCGAAS